MSISVFIAQGQIITPSKPICCWCKVNRATRRDKVKRAKPMDFCTDCAVKVFGYLWWDEDTKPLEGA